MSRNETTMAICGNLTADPEIRYTSSGVAVANFTVATNPRRYDQSSGEWVDGTPTFMRCDVWRELGEHCAETLTKGSRVVVSGALTTDTWETDKGEKRSAVKIVADDVGASLLYATAKIVKATRLNGSPPATDPRTGEAATERKRPVGAPDDEPPF
ncbi:MAG: single-stranded DNA-binding protein [Candidatus Dormibacteria bacterium]